MSSGRHILPDRASDVDAWRAKLHKPAILESSLPPSSPPPPPSPHRRAARLPPFDVHHDDHVHEAEKTARDDPFGFFAAERRLRARPPSSRASASTAAAGLRDPLPPSSASAIPEDPRRRTPSPSPSDSSAVVGATATREPLRSKDANAPITRSSPARSLDKPTKTKAAKAREPTPVFTRAAKPTRRRAKKPVATSEDGEEIVLLSEVDEEEEKRKRIEYFKSLDNYELHKEDVYII
ncbi:hypothetical protein AURDEDRAFT_169266 [Auricularia subglabra TFB-10046 SS5]|nr:hypothetical protein AURDEDRAFT_169266 [Auricularia subglabra TFB-10046 SS5]